MPLDYKAHLVIPDTLEQEEQQAALVIPDQQDLLGPLDSLAVSESREQLVDQVLQDLRVHVGRLEQLDSQDHPDLRELLVTLEQPEL